MIPTSIAIPTVTASSGMATLLGPAAVLTLGAILVALAVLVARLAADGRPGRTPQVQSGGPSTLPVALRRAA
jgi:hypothetical protein